MTSGRSVFLALVFGLFLWVAFGAVGDKAMAQCGSCKPPPTCNTCQVTPPTNCCKPAPPPPSNQTCCSPNHNVYVPGVNVYVAPSVVVNANVNASINLTANNYNNNYNNNNNNNTNNQTNNNNNNNNGGGTPGTPGNNDNSNSNTNIINNVITATSSSVSNASSISNSSATGGAGGIGIGIGTGTGGGTGGGGGNTSVVVNSYGGAAAAAGGSSTAYAYGSAFSDSLGIGGGGGGGGGQMFFTPPMATGYINGLIVEGPERRQKVAYEATRKSMRRVIIQAYCLDDRDVPHPASQVTPDREIGDYEGEVYRCIAGARLQYVVSEFKAEAAACINAPGGGTGARCFNGGQTVVCNKNDALYYTPNGQGGGALACRPQKPARDCNERSLLRRFGAGVKILTILSEERYTAYREEVVREQTSSVVTNLALDGGVGGVAF